MVEEEKSLDVHVMISQVLVPLQMPPPSFILRQYSCAIVDHDL